MNHCQIRPLYLLPFVIALAGCAIGYNHTLFATKTNVGMDLDTKPPTAEISIARREFVIEPTYEKGQTLPVLASFKVDSGFWIFASISSTFAGGDAATIMAKLYGDPTQSDCPDCDSTLELDKPPSGRVLGIPVPRYEAGDVKPFVFGTDTAFGLKMAWSGTAGQFPDTVRLGFNRKEFALAPVFGTSMGSAPGSKYQVKMPSFLAVLDNNTTMGSMLKSGTRQTQYIATGKAAEQLTLHKEIRDVMLMRLDPVGYNMGVGQRVVNRRTAYRTLQKLSGNGDSQATTLAANLDSLKTIPQEAAYKLKAYYATTGPGQLSQQNLPVGTPSSFDDVLNYQAKLNASIAALQEALKQKTASVDGAAASTSTLQSDLKSEQAVAASYENELSKQPALIAAIQYYTALF